MPSSQIKNYYYSILSFVFVFFVAVGGVCVCVCISNKIDFSNQIGVKIKRINA